MSATLFHQFTRTLTQLSTWLDRAEADASARKYDVSVLLGSRLAPDQFAFTRQVQIACDTVKLGAARLTGRDAPTHADTETTVAELKARIASVVDFVRSIPAEAYADAATRVITQPRWEGKVMSGADYLHEHVMPNVFFHATVAYSILRHNGVGLGKRDYLGPLTQRPG